MTPNTPQDSQTLTAEQIAQGWKLRDCIPEAPVKRGDIWQGAEFLPSGKLHIREIVSGGDPEVFAWEFFDAYRTFSPDLPSPPVSGEAATWLKHAQVRSVTEPREDRTIHSVELIFETGEQSVAAFMALNALKFGESPITNEPVVWGKVDADTGPNLGDQLAAIDAEPIVPVRDKPIRRFAGNEPVGVTETWQTACDWLETTFGPIKPERIITRAKEEFEELESAETLEQQTIEAADVVMCLMRFPGLWKALVAKMAVNRARTWELRGDGTGYHVKNLSAAIGERG